MGNVEQVAAAVQPFGLGAQEVKPADVAVDREIAVTKDGQHTGFCLQWTGEHLTVTYYDSVAEDTVDYGFFDTARMDAAVACLVAELKEAAALGEFK